MNVVEVIERNALVVDRPVIEVLSESLQGPQGIQGIQGPVGPGIPLTRTVNGHPLSADVVIVTADIAGLDTTLAGKANLAGAAFAGAVTVPNRTLGDNSANAANTAFVAAAIANIVNSAPAVLDTLSELATALGNDANFATTVSNAIGLRAFDTAVVHNTGAESVAGVKTFSSSPIAPTPTVGDNSTKVATTAFVLANAIPPAIGGAITSGTSGSILYVNSSGQFAQDNANLFWDPVNKQLKITASGATKTPFKMIAADAQSADIWQYFASDGTTKLFSIGPGGSLLVGSVGRLSSPQATTIFLGGTPDASYSGQINTFIGYNSGNGNTVQYGNTFVGSNAGSGTSGDAYFNTFIGTNAGKVTTGRENTFIGYNCGASNTSGTLNVMIGSSVYGLGTGAVGCTVVGYGCGGAITSATYFTGYGYGAGNANTTGTENTYIGLSAGNGNSTGGFNTYIGSRAAQSHTAGNGAFVGYLSGSNLTTGNNCVAVGVSTPFDTISGNNQTNINNTFMATATEARIHRPTFYQRYDASNYFSRVVSSVGLVTIDAAGSGKAIKFATGLPLGFFGATPIVQPTTAGAAATFTANSGTAVNDASTFDGYTIGQMAKALRNLGALA